MNVRHGFVVVVVGGGGGGVLQSLTPPGQNTTELTGSAGFELQNVTAGRCLLNPLENHLQSPVPPGQNAVQTVSTGPRAFNFSTLDIGSADLRGHVLANNPFFLAHSPLNTPPSSLSSHSTLCTPSHPTLLKQFVSQKCFTFLHLGSLVSLVFPMFF